MSDRKFKEFNGDIKKGGWYQEPKPVDPTESPLVRCDIASWGKHPNTGEMTVLTRTGYIHFDTLKDLQQKEIPQFIAVRNHDMSNAKITLIQTDNINEINEIDKVDWEKFGELIEKNVHESDLEND